MRSWQVERRKRTRHLIEFGGLVVKAGIADKLQSEGGEHARGVWTKLGKTALAADTFPDAYNRSQPQQDQA
jgi:hypothetical protein